MSGRELVGDRRALLERLVEHDFLVGVGLLEQLPHQQVVQPVAALEAARTRRSGPRRPDRDRRARRAPCGARTRRGTGGRPRSTHGSRPCTIALSRLPPSARSSSRQVSRSFRNPNVRARLISLRNALVEKSMAHGLAVLAQRRMIEIDLDVDSKAVVRVEAHPFVALDYLDSLAHPHEALRARSAPRCRRMRAGTRTARRCRP